MAFLLHLHFYKLRAYKNMKLGGFHHLGDIPMKIHIKLPYQLKQNRDTGYILMFLLIIHNILPPLFSHLYFQNFYRKHVPFFQ